MCNYVYNNNICSKISTTLSSVECSSEAPTTIHSPPTGRSTHTYVGSGSYFRTMLPLAGRETEMCWRSCLCVQHCGERAANNPHSWSSGSPWRKEDFLSKNTEPLASRAPSRPGNVAGDCIRPVGFR